MKSPITSTDTGENRLSIPLNFTIVRLRVNSYSHNPLRSLLWNNGIPQQWVLIAFFLYIYPYLHKCSFDIDRSNFLAFRYIRCKTVFRMLKRALLPKHSKSWVFPFPH